MLADAVSTKLFAPHFRMKTKGEPTEIDKSKPSHGREHQCRRCCLYFTKSDGYSTGRSETFFKCAACNRLEGRLRNLRQGGSEFAKAWDRVQSDTLQEFFQEAKDLAGTELAEACKVLVQKIKTNSNEVSSGSTGEFWPLSYYSHSIGLTDDQCKGIEETCEKQWDNRLRCWTYCYDVIGRANKDTELLQTQSIFKPADEVQQRVATVAPTAGTRQKGKKQKQDKSSNTTSSDGSSSSSGSDAPDVSNLQSKMKKQKLKEKKSKKAELKRKRKEKKDLAKAKKADAQGRREEAKVVKTATQMASRIGPILMKLEHLIRSRVTLANRKFLPQYIIDEVQQQILGLRNADDAWRKALDTKKRPVISTEAVGNLVSAASDLAADFDSMITMADKKAK